MAVALVFVFAVSGAGISKGETITSENTYPEQEGARAIRRTDTYELYISKYPDAVKPQIEVEIEIDKYIDTDMDVEILENFEGSPGKSLKTDEMGYVTWEVDVPQEGLYNLYIEYFPIEGRSASIEREVWINGESPFNDAKHITFTRVWVNAEEVRRDNRDNDIRPRQVEQPRWQSSYFNDFMGYYNDPYLFYFNKGKNTLKLVSVKEPMVIRTLKLTQYRTVPSYKRDLRNGKKKVTRSMTANRYMYRVKAPFTSRTRLCTRSMTVRLPIRFRTTNQDTTEYDRGTNWQQPGQWIEWKVNADREGLTR